MRGRKRAPESKNFSWKIFFLKFSLKKVLGAAPLVLSSAQLNEKFLSDALASLGTDASLRSGQIHLIERHYCLHMLKVLRSAQQTDFFGQIMSYESLHSLYIKQNSHFAMQEINTNAQRVSGDYF